MSKIDKLGGYKNAKEAYEFLNSCRWHRTPEPDIDALGVELLEHRRANNIFEVGDSIVIHENYDSTFMPVLEILEDCGSCFKTSNGVAVKSYSDYWRHATNEEIAAGYRGAK